MYWNVIKRQQWMNGFDNVKGPVQLCEWQYMGEKKGLLIASLLMTKLNNSSKTRNE